MPRERKDPYKIDVKKLEANGYIVLTQEHAVKKHFN